MNNENQKTHNPLIAKIDNAIFHIDSALAKKLLEEISSLITNRNIKETNPEVYRLLQEQLPKLKIVAFPNLSDEEAADVLRQHYLLSFEIDVAMEDQLTGKLFSVPYIPRDELRKKLKEALLQNVQRLGNLTAGQWIREFEKMFDVRTRNRNAVVEFVRQHLQTQKLDSTSKTHLKDLIHTYDYLLVSTIPDVDPNLDEILDYYEKKSSEKPTYHPSDLKMSKPALRISNMDRKRIFEAPAPVVKTAAEPKMEKLNINNALKKYSRIGEQPITSSPIKLKHFPAPARPSVKNWIADFHQKMGVEKHTMVERSNYLFNSENAKNLISTERQKLAYVLKSLDEDMLLTVDAGNERITFPEKPAVSAREPLSSGIEPRIPSPPPSLKGRGRIEKSPSSPPFKKGEEGTEEQRFHFSSPHKFLTEDKPLNRISPMGRLSGPEKKSDVQKKNPEVNKNTVDLRESS